MERHRIPRYVNALPQILWWEIDEFAFFLGGVVVGILTNHSFLGALIGIILSRTYMKLKYAKQAGFLFHWLYAKGLYGKKGLLPEYWIKELVE
ncbi:MAG: type IV conjugative transfer system protein TraL [Aquificaceae bacterium]